MGKSVLLLLSDISVEGRPILPSMNGTVPFISDIGATYPFKIAFIACCSVVGASFILTLVAGRYLHHADRLPRENRRREKILAVIATVFAITGSAGLILLSVFDTVHYPSRHDGFLLMFIVSVVLSAIATFLEYFWIRKDYPDMRSLRTSYIVKIIVIGVAFCCAIAFGVCIGTSHENPAGVLEWVTALMFDFYLWTFVYDHFPGASNRRRKQQTEGSDGARFYA